MKKKEKYYVRTFEPNESSGFTPIYEVCKRRIILFDRVIHTIDNGNKTDKALATKLCNKLNRKYNETHNKEN